jgi:hypothetical protein
MAKKELEETGKTTQINECVMDKLEIIQTSLAPELQEIYDIGFIEGIESKEKEISDLKDNLQKLRDKIKIILAAFDGDDTK